MNIFFPFSFYSIILVWSTIRVMSIPLFGINSNLPPLVPLFVGSISAHHVVKVLYVRLPRSIGVKVCPRYRGNILLDHLLLCCGFVLGPCVIKSCSGLVDFKNYIYRCGRVNDYGRCGDYIERTGFGFGSCHPYCGFLSSEE